MIYYFVSCILSDRGLSPKFLKRRNGVSADCIIAICPLIHTKQFTKQTAQKPYTRNYEICNRFIFGGDPAHVNLRNFDYRHSDKNPDIFSRRDFDRRIVGLAEKRQEEKKLTTVPLSFYNDCLLLKNRLPSLHRTTAVGSYMESHFIPMRMRYPKSASNFLSPNSA